MISIADIKAQKKRTLRMILSVGELRKSYSEDMASMSYLKAMNNDGMPHGSDIGNPAQNEAIRLVELEEKKNWIMAIELMEKTLTPSMEKFLELRRDAEFIIPDRHSRGKKSWIDYVQAHYSEWVYNKYGKFNEPSRRTMIYWVDDITTITLLIAMSRGLIKLNF